MSNVPAPIVYLPDPSAVLRTRPRLTRRRWFGTIAVEVSPCYQQCG